MAKYKRDIEAYRRKTEHLSLSQHGAYGLLLDHYYYTGLPLTKDVDGLCRLLHAMTEDEKAAVKSVLHQYFTLVDGAYHQKRADEELGRTQLLSQTRRKLGAIGNANRTQLRTQTERISERKPDAIANAIASANNSQKPEVCELSRGSEIQEQEEVPNSLALRAKENLVTSQAHNLVSPREVESLSLAPDASLGLEGRSARANPSPIDAMRLRHGRR